MKRDIYRPIWLIVAALVGMLAYSALRKPADDRIPWRPTLSAARAESAVSKKPVLAYFTANWCDPCARMRETTWADPRVEAALRERVVPVRIDIDQDPRTALEMNVAGIPHLQLIGPDGSVGPARVGFTSADELLRWLSGI